MLALPDLTLDIVPDWIERHCVIPDFEDAGAPFLLSDEQFVFVANHYAIRKNARRGMRAQAFVYRRSQLVRPQKWGKSPLIAAFVCVEAVGPVLFDGFAEGGEFYRCSQHDCGCGWVYEYAAGEPMGRPWFSPLIQITATSEAQTGNTYDALRPMIELGPLTEMIPRTGEDFIRLPNRGRIDVVTSKADSRLGQRTTFVPQDETGLWTASNGGHKLAKNQLRGLAGIGGRAIETTNAWDPAQDSTAQRTFESRAADIYRDFRQIGLKPDGSKYDFKKKRDRLAILRFNYAGAPWVAVENIDAMAVELLEKDPEEAERFFGNRVVAGKGHWISADLWRGAYAGRADLAS